MFLNIQNINYDQDFDDFPISPNYSFSFENNENDTESLIINSPIEQRPIFIICKKKRGRKCSKINKRIHSANDDDNIKTKIQIHYINFIVNFINDIIYSYMTNKDYLFGKFNHNEKRKVSKKAFDKLKSYTIKDLLNNFKISKKYKHKENNNKNSFECLCRFCLFKKIFDMNYLEFFLLYYYNDNKPLKEIIIDNKIIKLSTKTESFYYLIEKQINKDYKNNMIKVINEEYLKDIKNEKIISLNDTNDN